MKGRRDVQAQISVTWSALPRGLEKQAALGYEWLPLIIPVRKAYIVVASTVSLVGVS